MKDMRFKILYAVSFSVIMLATLGLPVLHLFGIGVPDSVVLLVGLCELTAAPVLVYSSMKIWISNKKDDFSEKKTDNG